MNRLITLVLVLSVALNGVLAYRYIKGRQPPAAHATTMATTTAKPEPKREAYNEKTWGQLSDQDLPDMVKQLQRSGFPPVVVRAIVEAQVRELFEARRKALDPNAQNEFWKRTDIRDAKQQAALRELEREQRRMVRDLVGPDADDPMSRMYRDRGLAGLPPEKADRVRLTIREYEDQRSDYMRELSLGGGSIAIGNTDQQKLTEIEKAQRAEIAKILTPEELERYELLAGRTAQSLRFQLSAFNPNEQEFLAIYKLQKAHDENFPPLYGAGNQADMQRRFEAQKQVTEQIKAALGAERGAEYVRATDYNYRQTSQLVARLELPPATTGQLYDIYQDFEKRQMEIRRGAQNREEAMSQLAALQQEAIEKVSPLLGGARGVEAYKQYGGNWITRMVPRTPPADAGAASGTGMLYIGSGPGG